MKFNPANGRWEDRLARNWSPAIKFSLPDKDVFSINANANPPTETGSFAGVGTILFNMAVNPVSGRVYVTNGDAHNEVRFEGPGVFGGSTVRGHLHEARITVLDGATVTPRQLNKHINYATVPSPAGTKEASLATPTGMAVTSDGQTLYVAAFGSSAVGVFNTAQLENNTFPPSAANHIPVSGGGPSGLVLDEAARPALRPHALRQRDLGDRHRHEGRGRPPAASTIRSRASVVAGRPFLYDAFLTSSNGEASCSSCHIFGDFDSLAWDLGNPDDVVAPNANPFRVTDPIGMSFVGFHPMKGPMTTQSLRGMANAGPMHWRGDRTGSSSGGSALDEDAAFKAFNVAFGGLLGRSGPLTAGEMQAFTDFILQVTYPPNPIRALNNVDTPEEAAGRNFFMISTPVGRLPELQRLPSPRSRARLLRHRRLLELRVRDAEPEDPAPPQPLSEGRHVRDAERALRQPGRQRQQGRPGAGLRLPPRRQHGHRLPLPRHHGVQPDEPGRLPDPERRRHPERDGRRPAAAADRGLHARPSTATSRRWSASS